MGDMQDEPRTDDATNARTPVLGLAQATALAHALCAAVAGAAGIRILTIKGPAAEHHGLRPARTAADADLLVDPPDVDRFCAALEGRGWRERVSRETPTLIGVHSRTFIHDDWPCDIDVHAWFPGFFAEPTVVFDELWRTRRGLVIGSSAVAIPSRAASAVIAALHALRNFTVPRHRQEWKWTTAIVRDDFRGGERAEFLDLVTLGRSRWVLRDLLRDVTGDDVEAGGDLTAEERRRWQAHVDFGADGGAAGWWLSLRGRPVRAWPGVLRAAVWVPRADIPRNDPAVLPGLGETWSYQLVRWRRGLGASLRFAVRGRARAS